MRVLGIIIGAFVLGVVGYWFQLRPDRAPASPTPALAGGISAQLIDGIGDHRMEISAASSEVQRWFDQGLVLAYAFNHEAASRAFLRAAELDPACAMCWWGAALVLGPHVNAGMDPASVPRAWDYVQKARQAASGVSDREQAYIAALARRYAQDPPQNRRPLDEDYALAMRELIGRYPQDLDARTLYAEALMNLHPWDFYDREAVPRPWTPEIVAVLEKVLLDNPDHPGANHYYIHVVEASSTPERGLDAARRLEKLVPAAGHLLHMSAHIYIRTGRYHEASLANLRGIEADRAYLALCQPGPGVYPQGYVPHNHHFLYASAMMEGASERAIGAAMETASRMDLDLSRQPSHIALQHFWVSPYLARVRFGRWSEILAEPAPPSDLVYPSAIWHYARGTAYARQRQLEDAEVERQALAAALANPEIANATIWGLNGFVDVLKVAERGLAGEILASRGDIDGAVRALQDAVAAQAALNYDEPPAWYYPVRHSLGAVLLEAGRPAEAERVYLADLARNRENGWSLFGLAQALRAQQRLDEAAAVEQRFQAAWKHADVKLRGSRF